MASSLVKINVHLIFHIKTTSIPMRSTDLPRIFNYLGGILRSLGSIPFIVGGVDNHIHILTTLPASLPLADLVRTTKAKSSRWIKTLDEGYSSFSWQNGYGAFSVSPSVLETTIDYIKNQDKHHRVKSFEEEYKALLDAYQISYDGHFAFDD